MTKLYTIIFSFTYLLSTAQTITQSFNEPSVGDVDKNYTLDTSAYTTGLPNNISGNNVVWDFTKVAGAFPIVFDSIIAPSAAPGGSAFPTATYAQKRGTIVSFFKSVTSPQQTEWLSATSSSPSLTVTFTNSALVATYPISFGYSHTDPVTGTFKYNNTTGACNGSITVTADGTGTVNFPNGITFTNVIRLKSVEQLTMSTTFPIGSISQSIYSYYAPGFKYPVISVQYQNYQLLVGTPTITAAAYGNFNYFTVTGINEQFITADLKVFPNPFTDNLNLSADNAGLVKELRFYNLMGEMVSAAASTDLISFEDLPPGVYLLEIRSLRGSSYQKVIRQ
jgi:hypothetical protein